ncbi:MAG: Mur ligase family protein [Bacteroidetes bacterium]|nr:Mur ligase family protein [Bacteroidota bacterium]
MRIHLIAIGGSAMHNMALALHKKGFTITGSDDEIFEPSKTRLKEKGLLPETMGWDASRITSDIDAVILGMHARKDNPELLRAQELGMKIYSYPEYIYEQSKDKKRVVISGSHGKTTITAMVLHALHFNNMDCDYMVGAKLEGFDTMVKLTKEAPIIILEGDEYLSSPIDRRPKFLHYLPHVVLMSGIAWDHINVFPTFPEYCHQFELLIDLMEKDGRLIYFEGDENIVEIVNKKQVNKTPYSSHPNVVRDGKTYLLADGKERLLKIFGQHNLQNLSGAMLICKELGLSNEQFYTAIATFKGAAKRLEWVAGNDTCDVYKDFAHSPSKLKATTKAVKDQFPNRKLMACMELHTFSSLNEDFLKQYEGSMDTADDAIVYFSPHAIEHKKLKPITEQQVKDSFKNEKVKVITSSEELKKYLLSQKSANTNFLLMSSGDFDGINVNEFGKQLV